MVRCFVALGGNVGDVAGQFSQAIMRLQAARGVRIGPQSSLYRTVPVGDDAGGDFLNAAVELQTELLPLELLELLLAIENEAGRTRTVRWSPRPLDLDLILYGAEVVNHPRLTVPHEACWYRRFVLDPLAEIGAETVHPIKQVTIGELRSRLLERPLQMGVVGGAESKRDAVLKAVRDGTDDVAVFPWQPSEPMPALLAWLGAPADRSTVVSDFEQLPVIPRIDASHVEEPGAFLRHVLASALMEPRLYSRPLRNTP